MTSPSYSTVEPAVLLLLDRALEVRPRFSVNATLSIPHIICMSDDFIRSDLGHDPFIATVEVQLHLQVKL